MQMHPKVNANGKLGLKHTRNVAEISDSITDGGRSEYMSVVSATPNHRAGATSLSPKASFLSGSPRVQTSQVASHHPTNSTSLVKAVQAKLINPNAPIPTTSHS